jgi:tetratricopeptide (TPR) repeat protein
MPWFKQNNAIDDALAANDLERAMELLHRLKVNRTTNGWRRQLVDALVKRANGSIASQQLPDAWADLTNAARFADASLEDVVAKQTTRLIELTIESADAMLQVSKTNHALDLIDLLAERDIADWRADRIREVAECLMSAERLAALGKLNEAIDNLNQANTLYPELKSLDDRIESKRRRQQKLDVLTQELQSAALSCQWNEVVGLCQKILIIAPQHEIAIGAQRHAALQMKRRTSVGSRLTNVPASYDQRQKGDFVIAPGSSNSKKTRDGIQKRSTIAGLGSDSELNALASKQGPAELQAEAPVGDSFLIWVDGVGGYLVCTKPINIIGQAIQGSTVSIPLQADVRQRHARIETVDGQHLIQPMGPMQINGCEVPLDESQILRTGQTILLGAGVELAYSQTHPLSKSARMDFVSRHRTLPWSDGIILAGKSLILGPNPNNHIFCPRWKADLILYRREDSWYARCDKEFCIDQSPRASEGLIRFTSHLAGEDFSLTLEPAN